MKTRIALPIYLFLSISGFYAAGTLASAITDTETLYPTNQATPVSLTGQPIQNRRYDIACFRRELHDRLYMKRITVSYSISSPSSKIPVMSATAYYLGSKIALYPEGLSNLYAFMSDGVPAYLASKGIERIIFSVNRYYGDAQAQILFAIRKKDAQVNCALYNVSTNF